MKLTFKKIEALNPCEDGLRWYKEHGSSSLLKTLLDVNKYKAPYARWLFTRLATKEQNIKIAIFAAEQVLCIYESKYPNDSRPREAIKAAKKYLKNPTKKNKDAAADAADAAYAAADAAAAYDAAAAAAVAAAAAAYAADVDYQLEIQKKIIKYAASLISRKRGTK